MNLSDEDRERLLEMLTQRILDEIREEVPDLAELVRIPAVEAARLAGVRPRDLAGKCRVIRDGHRSNFVTLAAYRDAFVPDPAIR